MSRFQCPLVERNASAVMLEIWSPRRKFTTWRKLWLALAESQRELGLSITSGQIEALRAHLEDIDFGRAAELERKLRHDVMAHVHAYGEVATEARGIIHLGATSQFVNCNTELLLMRESLDVVCRKTAAVIDRLAKFAVEYKSLPTLGFTHFQPAQPVTVGKRAALWAHDLVLALEDLEHRRQTIGFRGVKGTTGTQASFLALFDGDHDKVLQLETLVARRMGVEPGRIYTITGQTYPRVVDVYVLSSLAALAAVATKITNDIRILAGRKELEEPFEADQIGSSAMAYKRNPMRSERVAGLARFVMSMVQNACMTAAGQWLERTLDDSSNRRLSLAEGFLATDGFLDLLINISEGLVVYPATIGRNLEAELPFMATEEILMAGVRAGGDRQELHEAIRRHSQAAAQRVKAEGGDNDLVERLRGDPLFAGLDLEGTLDPARFIGRAPEQVEEFVESIVEPIRLRYPDLGGMRATVAV
ncbi:MAG: adenylosuccinate lyase [Phycisphaeraceae bacterium]|nr:adenylosuccinate lyase [Phycisphaeraceae bacterium]